MASVSIDPRQFPLEAEMWTRVLNILSYLIQTTRGVTDTSLLTEAEANISDFLFCRLPIDERALAGIPRFNQQSTTPISISNSEARSVRTSLSRPSVWGRPSTADTELEISQSTRPPGQSSYGSRGEDETSWAAQRQRRY